MLRELVTCAACALFAAALTGCQGGAATGAVAAPPQAVTGTPTAVATAKPTTGATAGPLPTPSASATAAGSANASSQKWISTWADAPTGAGPDAVTNMTVREILKPSVGSRGTIRLHFSNYFGTSAITLGSVHIGAQTAGAAVTNDVPVTFAGAKSAAIPAGGFLLSDPVAYTFSYGAILAVTEYIEGTNPTITFHEQGMGKVTSYQTALNAGDATADTAGASFTGTTMNTYLLDRVDVLGNYKETVVTFGSSTTDGYEDNSLGIDMHVSWPEQLAAALHAIGHDDIGIANAGIAGNTAAYPFGSSVPVEVPDPIIGPPGFQRFARDVLAVPGAGVVIDYLGADDVRNFCDPSATEIIPFKQSFVAQAHAAGLRIYEATTAPSCYCEVQNPAGFGTRFPAGFGEEAVRLALVSWERATAPITIDGTLEQPSGADGVIDFDGAITDPSNTSYMLPQYDSGDDVHPNAAGYAAMVRAIPLSQL
jgi:lysophospholipase L1-like esterase